MPRAKAKLDPLLLSTTGTRVDNLKLDFPLRLQDIDDVLITGSGEEGITGEGRKGQICEDVLRVQDGDHIVYSEDAGGWITSSS